MTMQNTIGRKIEMPYSKWKMFKGRLRFKWKMFCNIPRSVYLSLRFPFLYPRNRFTGLHYNNWRIIDKMKDLYAESTKIVNDGSYHTEITNKFKWFRYKMLKFWHDKVLQVMFWIPTFNELDSMDKGWRRCFGIQMCKEIKDALLAAGGRKLLRKYRIMQIKEKFGMLMLYDRGAPKDVNKIIEKYEFISFRTCIDCGAPATGYTTGWVEPYCDKCAKKNNVDDDRFERFGTKENTWYGYYTLD